MNKNIFIIGILLIFSIGIVQAYNIDDMSLNITGYDFTGATPVPLNASFQAYFCNDLNGFNETSMIWSDRFTQVTNCSTTPFFTQNANTSDSTFYLKNMNLTSEYQKYNSSRFVIYIKLSNTTSPPDSIIKRYSCRSREYASTNISQIPRLTIIKDNYITNITDSQSILVGDTYVYVSSSTPNTGTLTGMVVGYNTVSSSGDEFEMFMDFNLTNIDSKLNTPILPEVNLTVSSVYFANCDNSSKDNTLFINTTHQLSNVTTLNYNISSTEGCDYLFNPFYYVGTYNSLTCDETVNGNPIESIGLTNDTSNNFGVFRSDFNGGINEVNFDCYDDTMTDHFYYNITMSEICVPNWVNTSTSCNGFNYTIQYNDTNNCNSSLNLPVDNGTIVDCYVCTESWIQNDTACNGYNYTIQYYDFNECNTTTNLPVDNGTIENCTISCNWLLQAQPCINNVQLIVYNQSVGFCTEPVPSNNGTYSNCITEVKNTYSLSNDQLIILICLLFALITLIGGIFLHEAFFLMTALLFAIIESTFIIYKYPTLLIIAGIFMILLFVAMFIIIKRIRR